MKYFLLGCTALIAINTSAKAEETIKWRHVQHTAAVQGQQISDVSGHSLNLYRMPGLATFSDGSIGKTTVIGISDVTGGNGAVQGYVTVEFGGGAELYLKYTGEVKATGARKGNFVVTGGKGKYTDAKGAGTWQGDGMPATTPEAMSYIDAVVTVSCPNSNCSR